VGSRVTPVAFLGREELRKDLRNHSLTSNDLHTFCNVLYVDDGSMQSSLPTPDRQATNLLDEAYRDFASRG